MPSEFLRPWLSGRRILIVEDRYLVADDLRRLFTRLGAKIAAVVGEVEQATALAVSGELDLAVLDIDLRVRDVFDVAAIFETRGTPFVFVTGYARAHLPKRYRTRPIVSKPFSERELLAAIRAAMRVAATPGETAGGPGSGGW